MPRRAVSWGFILHLRYIRCVHAIGPWDSQEGIAYCTLRVQLLIIPYQNLQNRVGKCLVKTIESSLNVSLLWTPLSLSCGFIHASSFGLPNTSKTSINWSKVSRGPSKWSGLEHLCCEERLRGLGLHSLERSWLWGHLTTAYQKQWGGFQGDGARLLQRCMVQGWDASDRNWNKKDCIQVDTRKNCSTMRTVKQWKKVHREDAPPSRLEVCSICLDKALRYIVWSHSWACFKQDDLSNLTCPLTHAGWKGIPTLFQSL